MNEIGNEGVEFFFQSRLIPQSEELNLIKNGITHVGLRFAPNLKMDSLTMLDLST